MQKRKVSCTLKRENTLEIQERIYRLAAPKIEPIHAHAGHLTVPTEDPCARIEAIRARP